MAEGFGSNVRLKPPVAVPTALASTGIYDTGVFALPGPSIEFGYLAAGSTSYSFQRYLDSAKLLPVGAALTGTGTGATATVNGVNDGKAALYADLTITDTSSATNAITAFSIISSGTGP